MGEGVARKAGSEFSVRYLHAYACSSIVLPARRARKIYVLGRMDLSDGWRNYSKVHLKQSSATRSVVYRFTIAVVRKPVEVGRSLDPLAVTLELVERVAR